MSGRIVIVGAGAFGTALAASAARSGKADVLLLCRDPLHADSLRKTSRNDRNLPGLILPSALLISTDRTALGEADIILMAMPSSAQREAARDLKPFIKAGAGVVICAKGFAKDESGQDTLISEALEPILADNPISILSGPGFATDIARGLPTAMVIASANPGKAERLARQMSGKTFRLYPSIDRIGVQLSGALKNVLAIGCGIVEGAGLGQSARAALITRSLTEMMRLASAMGGSPETVRGLAGLGDLVLTATSPQSRNLRFGIEIGRAGRVNLPDNDLVEGAHAAPVAARLARHYKINMPITQAVADIIEGRLDVESAISQLLSRPITLET